MQKISRALLLFISLAMSPARAEEQDTITLFGTAIPGMFDDNEPGPYNTLYNRLLEGVRADVVLTMLPIRRATRFFSARGVDCMFLGAPNPEFYSEQGLKADEIIYSNTVKAVALKVYAPIGTAPYEDASILFTGNYVIDMGVGEIKPLGQLIPVNREGVLFASTLVDGFKLLDQKRVVALVAIDVDVQTLQAKNKRYLQYPVSKTFELRRTKDVFVCRRFPRTERFIADINSRVSELKGAGLLDSIFAN